MIEEIAPMETDVPRPSTMQEETHRDIQYVAQMLAELCRIARLHEAQLLAYLTEMAYSEAQDILAGRQRLAKP